MGGFFGVASREDCVEDIFYGTDYHSHLGTKRGGMATLGKSGFTRFIHNIENSQFRSKFEDDVLKLDGNAGIGVISDYEDQPLIIGSHLGTYAIVTVGKISNADELAANAFGKRTTHFSEMGGDGINPTELVATLINQESTFQDGIRSAQEAITGSCSMLLLTKDGVYAARDKFGRTPVAVARSETGFAATMETCALPNLGYHVEKYLAPGEVVLMTAEGIEQKKEPFDRMQICAFFWVYFGYPASCYEGINVETVRNKCGELLAENDDVDVDFIAGIPDSGTAHAIGYANKSGIPYRRPYVKYTPTWPRSFMPQNQEIRERVARMKLIPVRELTEGKKLLFCDDSIVRGTQLSDTVQRLYECGADEIHMRPACPPLVYGCKFLNFSRSSSELVLAARKAIKELEGENVPDELLQEYADSSSEKHHAMVDVICKRMNLTSLKYQKLSDLVEAIGLPKEKLCTYCWDGVE